MGPLDISEPSPLRADIFVGDVSLMSVTAYIRWCHLTDEYIVTFVGVTFIDRF
jgi:hypothetical protein